MQVHGKMMAFLSFRKIYHKGILFSRYFSIKYLCLYFLVTRGKNSMAVANLG